MNLVYVPMTVGGENIHWLTLDPWGPLPGGALLWENRWHFHSHNQALGPAAYHSWPTETL